MNIAGLLYKIINKPTFFLTLGIFALHSESFRQLHIDFLQ
jgi:hypothetical protein